MKQGIHPQVNTNVTVTCACGNTFQTMSTSQSISVDICSVCHPFYTGKAKFVDVEGRIDKFNKKMKVMAEKKAVAATKAQNKAKKQASQPEEAPKQQLTLKEMLDQARTSN